MKTVIYILRVQQWFPRKRRTFFKCSILGPTEKAKLTKIIDSFFFFPLVTLITFSWDQHSRYNRMRFRGCGECQISQRTKLQLWTMKYWEAYSELLQEYTVFLKGDQSNEFVRYLAKLNVKPNSHMEQSSFKYWWCESMAEVSWTLFCDQLQAMI